MFQDIFAEVDKFVKEHLLIILYADLIITILLILTWCVIICLSCKKRRQWYVLNTPTNNTSSFKYIST